MDKGQLPPGGLSVVDGAVGTFVSCSRCETASMLSLSQGHTCSGHLLLIELYDERPFVTGFFHFQGPSVL